VIGNYLGTDVTGTVGLGNGAAGVEIERVPLRELPGGGPGDDSFVGLTCTF